MFGIFRLFLAILVALSHLGYQYKGFNPGQWAVVAFYLLSGFLMQKQADKLCANNTVTPFYLDRLLRIGPLYICVLLFATPIFVGSWSDYVQNIALFPLNYATFTHVRILIGPAWSLACEAHFYLLVPFLFRLSTQYLKVVCSGSLLLFVISPFLPHTSFWAYSGLPGIFFVFASGLLIARRELSFARRIWIALFVLLVGFSILKQFIPDIRAGININVCIGFVLLSPIFYILSPLSAPKIDRRLGLLSYPLFLCHEPVAYYVRSYSNHNSPTIILGISLLVSWFFVVCVEVPFDKIRYGIRRKSAEQ